MLAFDTTNFDTYIATTTAGKLARRGHAKSKRSDLRVVGLATLVSETGHVPLLHRTYPGNGSDQTVLGECLTRISHRFSPPRPAKKGKSQIVNGINLWRCRVTKNSLFLQPLSRLSRLVGARGLICQASQRGSR